MGSQQYVVETVIMMIVAVLVSIFMMVYYFRKRGRSLEWWIQIILFLSILICVAPPLLLAVDIDASSLAMLQKQKDSFIPWMYYFWSTVYWSTQIFSWIILPIVQDYDSSGEFGFKKRVWGAIKFNIKFYVIIGAIGGALIIYALVAHVLNSIADLQEIGMAASNAFGLTLLVFLLSTGLVAIPKNLWRQSDKDVVLADLLTRLPAVNEKLDNARVEWDEFTIILRKLGTHYGEAHELQLCHKEVKNYVENFEKTCLAMRMRAQATTPRAKMPEEETSRDALVELNANIKKTAHTIYRLEYQYNTMTAKCLTLQTAKGIYWTVLRKSVLRTLAILLGLLSTIIVWSEAVIPFTKEELGSANVSVVQMVVMGYLEKGAGIQVIVFGCVLGYMAIACYSVVFQFSLFEAFLLTPSTSDAASMAFVVTQATRVIMPLCYNFLNMINMSSEASLVMYSRVFGDMDVVVFLGPWFNHFIPLCILILSVLNLAGVFPKLAKCLNVGNYDDLDAIDEGRELVTIAAGRATSPKAVERAEAASPTAAASGVGSAPISLRDKYRRKT